MEELILKITSFFCGIAGFIGVLVGLDALGHEIYDTAFFGLTLALILLAMSWILYHVTIEPEG